MENNFLNSNFFQNTPQKDNTNKSLILPNQPSSGFPNSNNQMNGLSNLTIPNINQPFGGSTGMLQNTQQGYGNPTGMLGQNIQQGFGASNGLMGQSNQQNYGAPTGTLGSNTLGQRLNPFGISTPTQNPFSSNISNSAISSPGIGGINNSIVGSNLNSMGRGLGSSMGSGMNTFGMPQVGSQPNSNTFGTNTISSLSTAPSSLDGFRSNSFGSAQPSFGSSNNPSFGFGASSPFTTAASTITPQGSSSSYGASSIPGTWSMASKGSKTTPYCSTRIKEDTGIFGDLIDITGMKDYANKSVDEIRSEDYEMSLYPPKLNTPNFVQPNLNNSTGANMFSSVSNMFNSGPKPITSLNSGFQNLGPSNTSSSQPSQLGQSSGILGMTHPFVPNNTPNLSSQQNLYGNSTTLPQNTTSNLFGTSVQKPFENPNSRPLNTGSAGMNLFGSMPSISTTASSQATAIPQSSNLFGQQSSNTTVPNIFANKTLGNDSTFISQPPQSIFQPASNTGSLFGSQPSFNPAQSSAAPNFQSGITNLFQNTQPSSISQTGYNAAQLRCDMNDPYLLKNIAFEKNQQQKHSFKIQLPTPLFNNKKESSNVEIKLRSPRPVAKNSIYTIPNLNDVDTSSPINSLVIGFEGKGRVEYQEPVAIKSFDEIEKKLMFRNESVESTDAIGTGLNKKARVYVEGLYPVSRATNEIIKGKAELFPQKGIQERFIYQLKNDSSKKFIDYDVDKGIYVYEVNHF